MTWQFCKRGPKGSRPHDGEREHRSRLAELLAPGLDLEVMSPPLEQRIACLLSAVDAHLDAAARAKGCDNIARAALRSVYAGQ